MKITIEELKQEIKKINNNEDKRIIIAIDGPAASGKTTFSSSLDGFIFHMDDFFLPRKMKTKERLAEVGGNIHYERFLNEVLIPLSKNTSFWYHTYNCKNNTLEKHYFNNQKNIIIVEGVYAYHPLFQPFYQYLIYFDISKENQLERLKKRSTPVIYQKFIDEWLKLEDIYFQNVSPKEKANFIIENNN